MTEREEITLPVSASVLDGDRFDDAGGPPPAAGARLLSSERRDPHLGKTVPLTVRDDGAGTKRFAAPVRDPEAEPATRPDFYNDGDEDEDEA